MGRLTEVFDVIKNGFDDPENYHWIDVEDENTRDILKVMRQNDRKQQKKLYNPVKGLRLKVRPIYE